MKVLVPLGMVTLVRFMPPGKMLSENVCEADRQGGDILNRNALQRMSCIFLLSTAQKRVLQKSLHYS